MWLDVTQNTPEWEALRIGRIGGSAIKYIMANYGKPFGKPAHDIALQIALEKIDGQPHGSGYSNAHFERGHEQEPVARMFYEETTFCDVLNGGYFVVDENIGVSPDGRVGDNGIIEIKSRTASVFYDAIKRGGYDPTDKWQIFFNLKSTGKSWLDYIEFCADFPVNRRLQITRVLTKDISKEFDMIDSQLYEFRNLVTEKTNVITGNIAEVAKA